jgi:hypothetical protein
MSETLSNDDRLTRSPICPPWCCGHSDDPDEFAREGQVRHFNAVGGMTGLWKLANVVSGEVRRGEFASYDVNISEVERADGHRLGDFVTLDVTAPQTHTGERTPVELRLTAGEARSLAAILSRAADLLEVWR